MAIHNLQVLETAGWWEELSVEGKKEYIAEHPDSKYAREAIGADDDAAVKDKGKDKKAADSTPKPKAKDKGKDKSKEKTKPEPEPEPTSKPEKPSPSESTGKDVVPDTDSKKDEKEFDHNAVQKAPKSSFKDKLKSMLGKKALDKADEEFFASGGHKPGSEARKNIAGLVKQKSKGIVAHLKSQKDEWHHGIKAIKKMAKGESLSSHDKEALQNITKDILITVGSVTVTGGLGHGLALALGHFGVDLVKDIVLKSAAHGLVHASILPSKPSFNAFDRLREISGADDRLMEQILEKLSDFIANGEIPDDIWEKTVTDLAKKNSRTNNVHKEEKPKAGSKVKDKAKGKDA